MRVLTQTTIHIDAALYRMHIFFRDQRKKISLMYAIYCERREMRNLTDRTLKDIGIDRNELRREYSRKTTDMPKNRS